MAAIMVKNGDLSKDDATGHPASSLLTRFVGMNTPALPDSFICDIEPGDRILLCSDGLYGMTRDHALLAFCTAAKVPEPSVND